MTRAYNAVSVILLVITALTYFFFSGNSLLVKTIGGIFPAAMSLNAAVVIFATFMSFGKWGAARTNWFLFFLSALFSMTAELTYFYLECFIKVEQTSLSASPADFFWVCQYLLIITGMVILIAGFMKSGLPRGRWMISFSLILLLGVFSAVIMYEFILKLIASDTEISTAVKIMYFFYPLADLIIIMIALMIMHITTLFGKGALSLPWKIIACSFIVNSLADIAYSYLDWKSLYSTGHSIDLLWGAGYWLLGLGALIQKKLMRSI